MKTAHLAFAVLLSMTIAAPRAFAQPAAPVADFDVNNADYQWRALPIKNIAPRFIAYQLDPSHNQQPTEFANPHDDWRKEVEQQPEALDKGVLGDEPEVRVIVAADAQKTILVLGTTAGIARVREWVNILDQPLRFVEIETEFVAIAPADTKALGFESMNDKTVQSTFVRSDYRKKLDELVAGKKAKILASPSLVAINNLNESVVVSESAPLQNWPGANKNAVPLTVHQATTVGFTPTINGDNTITMLIQTARQTLLMAPEPKADEGAIFGKLSAPRPAPAPRFPVVLQNGGNGLESIINLRDGQTAALTGLAPDLFDLGADDTAPKNVVMLVTARLVAAAKK